MSLDFSEVALSSSMLLIWFKYILNKSKTINLQQTYQTQKKDVMVTQYKKPKLLFKSLLYINVKLQSLS